MSLKEKLQALVSKLKDVVMQTSNVENEFDAELEDHPLGNQNVYRFHYINYHRIGTSHGRKHNNIGLIDIPFKPFKLLDGMNREDAFKVLSYLTDVIEKELHVEKCSYKSVAALDKVINLERLGFRRLNIELDDNSPKVIDLFTIVGRVKLFKESKYYKKYFEWYTEGVTSDEVKNIYDKCDIEFFDAVILSIEKEIISVIWLNNLYN